MLEVCHAPPVPRMSPFSPISAKISVYHVLDPKPRATVTVSARFYAPPLPASVDQLPPTWYAYSYPYKSLQRPRLGGSTAKQS
jgi:hypothetical protein